MACIVKKSMSELLELTKLVLSQITAKEWSDAVDHCDKIRKYYMEIDAKYPIDLLKNTQPKLLKDMIIREMRPYLRKFALKLTGTKPQLILRIENYLKSQKIDPSTFDFKSLDMNESNELNELNESHNNQNHSEDIVSMDSETNFWNVAKICQWLGIGNESPNLPSCSYTDVFFQNQGIGNLQQTITLYMSQLNEIDLMYESSGQNIVFEYKCTLQKRLELALKCLSKLQNEEINDYELFDDLPATENESKCFEIISSDNDFQSFLLEGATGWIPTDIDLKGKTLKGGGKKSEKTVILSQKDIIAQELIQKIKCKNSISFPKPMNSVKNELYCELCNFLAKNTSTFSRHLKSHKKCENCNKIFGCGGQCSRDFKNHIKKCGAVILIEKKIKEKKSHECEFCKKVYPYKSYLLKHKILCSRKSNKSEN